MDRESAGLFNGSDMALDNLGNTAPAPPRPSLRRDNQEQIRMAAARDLLQGLRHIEVANKYNVHRSTVSKWSKQLMGGGFSALSRSRGGGRPKTFSDADIDYMMDLFSLSNRNELSQSPIELLLIQNFNWIEKHYSGYPTAHYLETWQKSINNKILPWWTVLEAEIGLHLISSIYPSSYMFYSTMKRMGFNSMFFKPRPTQKARLPVWLPKELISKATDIQEEIYEGRWLMPNWF